jgi:hypothetical protein
VPLGGENTNQDLVADRRRPCRPSREPRGEGALAAIGHPKRPTKPSPGAHVATHDQAALLELMEHLVDLSDVGMPEGSHSIRETLAELVAVRLAFIEERQERVS